MYAPQDKNRDKMGGVLTFPSKIPCPSKKSSRGQQVKPGWVKSQVISVSTKLEKLIRASQKGREAFLNIQRNFFVL